jgi:hypothetical protein
MEISRLAAPDTGALYPLSAVPARLIRDGRLRPGTLGGTLTIQKGELLKTLHTNFDLA